MDEFFGKFSKGAGEGESFPIQKDPLQFFALETALLVINFQKNFEIGRGGGEEWHLPT